MLNWAGGHQSLDQQVTSQLLLKKKWWDRKISTSQVWIPSTFSFPFISEQTSTIASYSQSIMNTTVWCSMVEREAQYLVHSCLLRVNLNLRNITFIFAICNSFILKTWYLTLLREQRTQKQSQSLYEGIPLCSLNSKLDTQLSMCGLPIHPQAFQGINTQSHIPTPQTTLVVWRLVRRLRLLCSHPKCGMTPHNLWLCY